MGMVIIRVDVYDGDEPDDRYTSSRMFSLKTLRRLFQPSPAMGDEVLDMIDEALLKLEGNTSTG